MAINLDLHGSDVLLCHEEFVYIRTMQRDTYGIYKCIANEDQSSLKVINSNTWLVYVQLLAIDKDGQLYCYFGCPGTGTVAIVDGDTLTEITRLPYSHFLYHIAVSVNGTLVRAEEGLTSNEVRVCRHRVDGQLLIDSGYCVTTEASKVDSKLMITCTRNGNIVAGASSKLALLSNDLKPILFISTTGHYFNIVKCSPLDDTLVIVVGDGDALALLPPKAYQPPFSLTLLSISAVLQHAEVLLATYLPPGLQRLLKNFMKYI